MTALALLAGCGGSNSSSTATTRAPSTQPTVATTSSPSPSATSSAGSFPDCRRLLSTADVEAALGGAPKQNYTAPPHAGDGTGCLYTPTDLNRKLPWGQVGLTVVPLHAIPGTVHQTTTPVSGVGDEAYIHTTAQDQTAMLYVRSGSTVLTILGGMSTGPGAQQLCITLAHIAIGHL